ncbi:hypothetical protein LXL04_029151 [Taraxacum kok-saghyz]
MNIMNCMATNSDIEIGGIFGVVYCNCFGILLIEIYSTICRVRMLDYCGQKTYEEVIYYYYTHIYEEPCMTSEQTGEASMKKVLSGHPNRCICAFRMSASLSNRDVSERFQRSRETISSVFHEVLESLCGWSKGYVGLAREYIRPKDATFQCIPPHIENDSRYMPYFMENYCNNLFKCNSTL